MRWADATVLRSREILSPEIDATLDRGEFRVW